MKKLHAARHAVEAHLVCGFLGSHGVDAQVRGEFLTSAWGELPTDVCSVWVKDDAQFALADELLQSFLKGSYARQFGANRWTCGGCGESLEGQFTECWNCGTARDAAQQS